jgi:hypothetical protein
VGSVPQCGRAEASASQAAACLRESLPTGASSAQCLGVDSLRPEAQAAAAAFSPGVEYAAAAFSPGVEYAVAASAAVAAFSPGV